MYGLHLFRRRRVLLRARPTDGHQTRAPPERRRCVRAKFEKTRPAVVGLVRLRFALTLCVLHFVGYLRTLNKTIVVLSLEQKPNYL